MNCGSDSKRSEISRFLGDMLLVSEKGLVPDGDFERVLSRKCIQMRSYYEEYAGLYKEKRELFLALNGAVSENGCCKERALGSLVDDGIYDPGSLREELANLVRQNLLAYNPVTAEFCVQGRSMLIGLQMYAEMVQS